MIKSSPVLHLYSFVDAFHDAFSELCFLKTRLHNPFNLFRVEMSNPFAKDGIRDLPKA